MMTKTLVMAVLFVVPSVALASAGRDAVGEAVVEWRYEPQDKIIVDQEIWRCTGDICRGQVLEHKTVKARTCRLLARAGRVLRFSTPEGNFSEQELDRCNGRKSRAAITPRG